MSDLRTGKSDEKTEKSDLETALPQCHRPLPLRCGGFYQRMDGNGNFTDLLDAGTLFTQSSCGLIDACATYQIRIAEYRRRT